jgi:hypothetical protein
MGYKDAADYIVNGAIEGGQSFSFNVAYLVFPVVFLYRQYIELRLKETIIMGMRINGETHGFPQHHYIDELWKHARRYMEQVWPEVAEAYEAFGALVNEFSALDPKGMAFRYPVDREGELHLPEWSVINFRHLKQTMDRIGNLLDGVTELLYIRLQGQREFSEDI